jgi:hypothetical protein
MTAVAVLAIRPPQVVGIGWRRRIRTLDLLIQSLCLGISLASRHVSVGRISVARRIGVSQVPIPK